MALRVSRVRIEGGLAEEPGFLPKVRAKDLRAALLDPAEMARQDVTHPKPHPLIDRMRIVGEDRLTATDVALSELLLAWARHEGLDKRTHDLDGDVVKSFLGLARWADVEKSVARVRDTRVAFDIRSPSYRESGVVPMVVIHTRTRGAGGVESLRYEFPEVIERILTTRHDYTHLELKAFPAFTSKYSGRLYGLLAARANAGFWSVSPEELAEALGWTTTPLHIGTLKRRCIDPALVDIDQHVTRLQVGVDEQREAGRGRRVKAFVFAINRVGKPRLEEVKVDRIDDAAAARVRATDPVHARHLVPTLSVISRVCRVIDPPTAFGPRRARLTPEDASVAWRRALDEAASGRPSPAVPAPGARTVHGRALLEAIKRDGLATTFTSWLEQEWFERRFLSAILGRAAAAGQVRHLKLAAGIEDEAPRIVVPLFAHSAAVASVAEEYDLEDQPEPKESVDYGYAPDDDLDPTVSPTVSAEVGETFDEIPF